MIDTHTHYDDEQFDSDRSVLLSVTLPEAGIHRIINCGASLEGARLSARLSREHPIVYAAIGVHPDEVGDLMAMEKEGRDSMEYLTALASEARTVAIGEIGLDYHWMVNDRETQIFWFRKQLELARKLDLPVIIHSREAAADTMEILKEAAAEGTRGVLHCYSYSPEQAREYLKLGYYLGVGGVLTFKNSKKLKEVVSEMPADRILLETDCPYLAPTPHRGERNSSLLLPFVLEEIARLRGITREEAEQITEENAIRLFRF